MLFRFCSSLVSKLYRPSSQGRLCYLTRCKYSILKFDLESKPCFIFDKIKVVIIINELGWTQTQVELTDFMPVVVPLTQSLTLLLALPPLEESVYQTDYRLLLVKESFSLITEMVVRITMIVLTMSGS